MTTFREDDLFTETFDGFGEEGEVRQRPTWPTAVALVVAAVLVVGGLLWVKEGPRSGAAPTVSATTLLDVFARPQASDDVPPPDDLDGLSPQVQPETTRLLLTDAGTARYAAVSQSGRLCVLTVPSGDLPSATCVRPVEHTTITVDDHLVVATTGTDPRLGTDWTNTAPNVWTQP